VKQHGLGASLQEWPDAALVRKGQHEIEHAAAAVLGFLNVVPVRKRSPSVSKAFGGGVALVLGATGRKACVRGKEEQLPVQVVHLDVVAVDDDPHAGHTEERKPVVERAPDCSRAHLENTPDVDRLHEWRSLRPVTGAVLPCGVGAVRQGVAATVPAGGVGRLASDPNVAFVALDSPIMLAATGAVSTSLLATTFPNRDAVSKPWGAGMTGRGVGIAVIDSGVTPSADFDGRLIQVPLDGQLGSLDDTIGHGTMVAGIAAGRSPDGRFVGIAPGANVYALNISRPTGVYTSDVITALKWVFDNAHVYNIRVVNLSLTETAKSSYAQRPLDLAVERLWASGVFVAVSAGNLGAGQIDYAPANDPLVETVGAFDMKDTSGGKDDVVLPWSSIGVTVDGFAKPEIVVPGRHIQSPLPIVSYLDTVAPLASRVALGYASINGTSFAAPQVAGAAAILFQEHPAWNPDNLKWLLTAKPGPKPKNSNVASLNMGPVYDFSSTPGRAHQGVPALVCAPGATCLSDSTVASNWDSSSWNSSSWNSSSWNSSSWNSTSWNSTTNWDSSSWNSSGWNSTSWNTTAWSSDPLTGFDPWT
jgi:serine protease AprX